MEKRAASSAPIPGQSPAQRTIQHLIVLAAFAVSRAVYAAIGVRFYSESLTFYLQFVDAELLKTDLLRSLFYLHGQPPLFNLFLGVVLKAFPASYPSVFASCFLLIGVVFAATLLEIMWAAGVNRGIATLLTALFIASPSAVLYENWLFYTYPIAFLLSLTALLLYRFVRTMRKSYGKILFWLLAITILTRGIFNPVWLAVCIALTIWCGRVPWQMVVRAARFPVMLVLLFYLKQFYTFHSLPGSCYVGFNLGIRIQRAIDPGLRIKLVREEGVNPVVFAGILDPLPNYETYTGPFLTTSGVPILDMVEKSTGALNFHNLGYMRLSEIYLAESRYILSKHPEIYWRSLGRTHEIYNYPNWNSYGVNRVKGYRAALRVLKLLHGTADTQVLISRLSLFNCYAFPTLILFGVIVLYRLRNSRNRARFVLIGFLLFNIVYVTGVTTLISFNDFNRYRFKVDPFYLILFGLAISEGIEVLRRPFRKAQSGSGGGRETIVK